MPGKKLDRNTIRGHSVHDRNRKPEGRAQATLSDSFVEGSKVMTGHRSCREWMAKANAASPAVVVILPFFGTELLWQARRKASLFCRFVDRTMDQPPSAFRLKRRQTPAPKRCFPSIRQLHLLQRGVHPIRYGLKGNQRVCAGRPWLLLRLSQHPLDAPIRHQPQPRSHRIQGLRNPAGVVGGSDGQCVDHR